MTFTEACQIVVAECPNEYAKAYARAWLAKDVHMDAIRYNISLGEAAKTQALYILSNIGSWRGDKAKAVRKALKEMGDM